MGRPSGNNPMEDSHPRLLTNYMRTQQMVYDSSIETPRNEVEYMLSQCQKSIDDNKIILHGLLCYVNLFAVVILSTLSCNVECLVPPMTMDEEDEFGAEGVEGEGRRGNKGMSAVVANEVI